MILNFSRDALVGLPVLKEKLGLAGLPDIRAADYLGVAPVWVPVGTLGIAKDTVTKQIWFYSNGAWE